MKISKSFTLEQETIDTLNQLKKKHGSSSVSSLVDRIFLEIKIKGTYTIPNNTPIEKHAEVINEPIIEEPIADNTHEAEVREKLQVNNTETESIKKNNKGIPSNVIVKKLAFQNSIQNNKEDKDKTAQ